MTENEAHKLLHPDTTTKAIAEVEYYAGFRGGEAAIEAIEEACVVACNALEEIQQYRAIETELREHYHANVDIKKLMQYFIETIFKGEKHESFCILTNEDAEMWDAYRAIGTVEECRTAVERMKPKKPILSKEQNVRYISKYDCPSCGKSFTGTCSKSCYHCGQKLDWSE